MKATKGKLKLGTSSATSTNVVSGTKYFRPQKLMLGLPTTPYSIFQSSVKRAKI
jgi:hypothetical protein